jgi:2-polyprenyl-3-methyl-5-hydroxy-6-metoxy-1,4-benzoquinol methylase
MVKRVARRALASLGYEIRRLDRQERSAEFGYSPAAGDSVEEWQRPFETLRKKWVEVPTTRSGRMKTSDLLRLSDADLRREWEDARADITRGSQFAHRGWYHALYSEMVAGKKILDIGSGFAIDSITFAQAGAHLTFVDIAGSNLEVVKRLCDILNIRGSQFLLLDGPHSLHGLDTDYDIILAMGSLHHAPIPVIKPEVDELRRHLKIGGRWVQLAYPKTRWLRERCPRFSAWGEMTDGPGTPWAEWYDLDKLLRLHSPGLFDVVLCLEFHQSDFIWFDLLYRGERAANHAAAVAE